MNDFFDKPVKKLRYELHLTQVEFARLFGVHPITVSKWERGETAVPHWHQALFNYVKPNPSFSVPRLLATHGSAIALAAIMPAPAGAKS